MHILIDLAEQFDQAGVLVRADETTWTTAGVGMVQPPDVALAPGLG
jgi:regulation of enolase protein 1 (concanavalin A-like superfamily)